MTRVKVDRQEDRDRQSLRVRKLLSPLARLIGGGSWGSCYCCGMPWNVVAHHTTNFQEANEHQLGRGCFPLCVLCWRMLTPERRLPFYRRLIDSWKSQGDEREVWADVEAAVLRGR